jgi:hypothetical protein
MESLAEAISQLRARGFHAQTWDCPATPGAIAVASRVVETQDGIRILKNMVLVVPAGSAWRVCCELPVESEHCTLAEAVEVAAALVAELQAGRLPYKWLSQSATVPDRPRE